MSNKIKKLNLRKETLRNFNGQDLQIMATPEMGRHDGASIWKELSKALIEHVVTEVICEPVAESIKKITPELVKPGNGHAIINDTAYCSSNWCGSMSVK